MSDNCQATINAFQRYANNRILDVQDALEAAVPAYCASEDATEEGRNVLKEYQNAVAMLVNNMQSGLRLKVAWSGQQYAHSIDS